MHLSSPFSCRDPARNTNVAPAALHISPDRLHWPSAPSPLSCPLPYTGSCLQPGPPTPARPPLSYEQQLGVGPPAPRAWGPEVLQG